MKTLFLIGPCQLRFFFLWRRLSTVDVRLLFALKELWEIEDAFKNNENEKPNLLGKTVLDIGTDAVKPLYIALNFSPRKIIGITNKIAEVTNAVFSAASEIEAQQLFTKTKIAFYNCNFFDEETLKRICEQEGIVEKFDFILISKTLHHLRTAKARNPKHKCTEDENCCTCEFDEQAVFKRLLELGKRVIVYEYFNANEPDDDKERGQGGYFTADEWIRIFRYLSENYEVQLIKPKQFHISKTESQKIKILIGQVDTFCFYVEKQTKPRFLTGKRQMPQRQSSLKNLKQPLKQKTNPFQAQLTLLPSCPTIYKKKTPTNCNRPIDLTLKLVPTISCSDNTSCMIVH